MGKEDSLIMAVKKEDLFGISNKDFFEGFRYYDKIDYQKRILRNYGFMTRKFAEKDSSYKQPICYCLIYNSELKKFFSYQRAKKDKNYTEKRLQGKFSIGIGGHIEMNDAKKNPIHESMLREINEEVKIKDRINPKLFGYIYLDDYGVNEVHFGLVHMIDTNSKKIKAKDPEITNAKLRSVNELEEICLSREYEVEEWSKILINVLNLYFKN